MKIQIGGLAGWSTFKNYKPFKTVWKKKSGGPREHQCQKRDIYGFLGQNGAGHILSDIQQIASVIGIIHKG